MDVSGHDIIQEWKMDILKGDILAFIGKNPKNEKLIAKLRENVITPSELVKLVSELITPVVKSCTGSIANMLSVLNNMREFYKNQRSSSEEQKQKTISLEVYDALLDNLERRLQKAANPSASVGWLSSFFSSKPKPKPNPWPDVAKSPDASIGDSDLGGSKRRTKSKTRRTRRTRRRQLNKRGRSRRH